VNFTPIELHARIRWMEQAHSDATQPMPTYFRFLTLLALHIFVAERVEVVVLEVRPRLPPPFRGGSPNRPSASQRGLFSFQSPAHTYAHTHTHAYALSLSLTPTHTHTQTHTASVTPTREW
jgi:hypothetical protein